MNIIDKYRINSVPISIPHEIQSQPKSSFSQILENKFNELVNSIDQSEKLSMKTASNNMDIHTLATSLSIAEVNLRSFMKIHEQLLGALQEVSRMQV